MKIKKRIWYMLLAICLMAGQMTGIVQAEETNATVWVTYGDSGMELTAGTYYKTTAEGTVTEENASAGDYNIYWTEEAQQAVLILNNAYFVGAIECFGKPFKLILEGKSTVHDINTSAFRSAAIFAQNGLTIDGTGELVAIGPSTSNDDSRYVAGIKVTGDLTIAGGTITTIGSDGGAACCGINLEGGNIHITGGTIYANCALENGEIVSKAGRASCGFSGGIYINAASMDGSEGNFTIDGGTIYAFGGHATGISAGIIARNNMTISGGTIYAEAGLAEMGENYGIGATGNLTINGGNIKANGGAGTTQSLSHGIGSEGNITINGGTVDAVGGTSTLSSSYGIGALGKIIVTGGQVNSIGGNAGQVSYGMGSEQGTNISGGKVTTNTGEATYGFGIGTNGLFSMSGEGRVYASCNEPGQALGAVQGYDFGGTQKLVAGTSAEDAVMLDTIPTDFSGYKYIKAAIFYPVTIKNGTGSGEYAHEDVVTIVANEPEAGKKFAGWTEERGDVAMEIVSEYEATFSMPTEEVEITATYRDIVAPEVTSQPEDVTVKAGETATFEITATGEDIGYQWKVDKKDGNGWQNIEGANQSKYTTEAVEEVFDGYQYKCVVSNVVKSVESNAATLYVEELIPVPTVYEIEEEDCVWTKGSEEELSFTGSGNFAKFKGVKVDDEQLEEVDYDVEEGSTIVTLKATYLESLTIGKHTLTIVWEDGSASADFTVEEAEDESDGNNKDDGTGTGTVEPEPEPKPEPKPETMPQPNDEKDEVPDTGVRNDAVFWGIGILLSAVGMFVFGKKKLSMK